MNWITFALFIGIIAAIFAIATFLFPAFPGFAAAQARRFRAWLWDRIIGLAVYYIVLAVVGFIIVMLVLLGIVFENWSLTGFSFLAAIGLFWLFWFPHGLVLRVCGINDKIFPVGVRMFIAWLGFFGFLGVIYPDILSVKIMLVATFISIVAFAAASQVNWSEKYMLPAILIICFAVGSKWAFPDHFSGVARYIASGGQVAVTKLDRGSFGNETYAASTFGLVTQDIGMLYTANLDADGNIISLDDSLYHLKKNAIVMVLKQKERVKVYDGQGFVEIRLPRPNGSFVNGKNLWIESNLIQVGSKDELVASLVERKAKVERKIDDSSSLRPSVIPDTAVSVSVTKNVVLGPGLHSYALKAGQETPMIDVPDCGRFICNFSSPTYSYKIIYSDSTQYDGGPATVIPRKTNVSFKIRANIDEVVTVKVIEV